MYGPPSNAQVDKRSDFSHANLTLNFALFVFIKRRATPASLIKVTLKKSITSNKGILVSFIEYILNRIYCLSLADWQFDSRKKFL